MLPFLPGLAVRLLFITVKGNDGPQAAEDVPFLDLGVIREQIDENKLS